MLPRIGGSQLFDTGLERGEQLGGSSSQHGPSGGQSCYGTRSVSNNSSSFLGSSALVASSAINYSGLKGGPSSTLSSRSIGESGTSSKQRMEDVCFQGGGNVSWNELQSRVNFIRKQALAISTQKNYQQWWDRFQDFQVAFGVKGDPSVESVLNFIAFLEISGKGYGIPAAVAAIGRQC